MLTERDWARAARLMEKGKEFFYLGFYLDILGNWILKIGTTNDLAERMTQHNRDNLKLTNHPMMPGTKFQYLWFVPLSKYNSQSKILHWQCAREDFGRCSYARCRLCIRSSSIEAGPFVRVLPYGGYDDKCYRHEQCASLGY